MPDGLHHEFFLMRSVETPPGGITAYLGASQRPHDCAWRWTLRLALPLLVFLSGLVLYWIWFDRAYGVIGWDTIVVGLPLAIEAGAVALWSVGVWCSKDLV
jgi:hypothetical protein